MRLGFARRAIHTLSRAAKHTRHYGTTKTPPYKPQLGPSFETTDCFLTYAQGMAGAAARHSKHDPYNTYLANQMLDNAVRELQRDGIPPKFRTARDEALRYIATTREQLSKERKDERTARLFKTQSQSLFHYQGEIEQHLHKGDIQAAEKDLATFNDLLSRIDHSKLSKAQLAEFTDAAAEYRSNIDELYRTSIHPTAEV